MNRVHVRSTCLKSVGYEPATNVLELEFQNDLVYRFRHVPARVFQGLLTAQSKGVYFNEHVKDRYDSFPV